MHIILYLIGGTIASLLLALLALIQIRKAMGKRLPSMLKRHKATEVDPKEDILRDRYSTSKTREEYDCIIIGSGLSGMTCASLLAKLGKKVLVLEQHYVAGGSLHVFEQDGYEFDVGLHYVGNLGPGNKDLKYYKMITDPEDQIQWAQMGKDNEGIYDKMIIRDPSTGQIRREIVYKAGFDNLKATLYKEFPKEHKAIDTFFLYEHNVSFCVTGIFTKRFASNWVGKLKAWLMIKDLNLYNRTAYEVLSELTQDQDLITSLCYLWGDLGQPPKKISFMQLASVTRHYRNGGYYPVGGCTSIAKKIFKAIYNYGGRVLVGQAVKEITVYKNQVMGVTMANGDYIKSRQVISCANYMTTFTDLCPLPSIIQQLDILSYDPACLVLFVGLKGSKQSLGLSDSNIWQFISNQTDQDLDTYTSHKGNSSFPVLFVGSGSSKDPAWPHPHKQTIEIITFAKKAWWLQWQDQSCLSRDTDYQNKKKDLMERLLEEGLYRNYPECKGQVETCDLGTPLTCEHYLRSNEGSIYGIASTSQRLESRFDRLLVPSTPIKGLFMSGQDITGPGVISALQSGIVTVSTMMGYFQSSSLLSGYDLNKHINLIDQLELAKRDKKNI